MAFTRSLAPIRTESLLISLQAIETLLADVLGRIHHLSSVADFSPMIWDWARRSA